MACRTYDENGVRQINDPTEVERDNLIDNLWYERRDESTKDEKTHNPKFHKELVAFFEKTATIKQNRIDAMVFPIVAQAVDAQANTVSPTLALLLAHVQQTIHENRKAPKHSYQTWYETTKETLASVAEQYGIPFPVFLYNVSPFWTPTILAAENQLNEQQTKAYVGAMEKMTVSEMLAYLMAVGLQQLTEASMRYCRN